ncbi:hypothetical protein TRVL_06731 [Trypanosoma vivax]|nr:hypothetical protein TRVL_06731 [Trypanosoma vivax]
MRPFLRFPGTHLPLVMCVVPPRCATPPRKSQESKKACVRLSLLLRLRSALYPSVFVDHVCPCLLPVLGPSLARWRRACLPPRVSRVFVCLLPGVAAVPGSVVPA